MICPRTLWAYYFRMTTPNDHAHLSAKFIFTQPCSAPFATALSVPVSGLSIIKYKILKLSYISYRRKVMSEAPMINSWNQKAFDRSRPLSKESYGLKRDFRENLPRLSFHTNFKYKANQNHWCPTHAVIGCLLPFHVC